MGEFRERDNRAPKSTRNYELPDLEEQERTENNGRVTAEGVEEILAEKVVQDAEESDQNPLPNPEAIAEEIDYEDIRSKAEYVYTVNKADHLDVKQEDRLEIGIQADPAEMAGQLVQYLEEGGGNQALMDFTQGDLENENHWINLIGFGVVEEESDLSGFGEYIADQVFEYSEG